MDIKCTVKRSKSIFNVIFCAIIKKEKYCCDKKRFYRFFITICKNMLHFVNTTDSHTTPLSGRLLIFIDRFPDMIITDTTYKFYQYKSIG